MGRTLALDIGEKRIGVAVSDEGGLLARPLAAIRRASKREDFERIARLAAEHKVERVVAGYPRSLSGKEGPQAQRVRKYVEALALTLSVPVELWDERYTTVEAMERLKAAYTGAPGRRAMYGRSIERPNKLRDRGQIDAAAAAVILQDYLDARR